MDVRKQALALAGAAAAMTGQAHAQERAPAVVAVVDAGVTKLDFDDPNVRFVQANPDAQKSFASREVDVGGGYTHGDIVASSFVREYRKLEPDRPIVIYAVNPYRDTPKGLAISTRAVAEAMPVLKAANVKVAVTAFGLRSEEAGETFMRPFREAGVTVFAAVPNDPMDGGLFPARSAGAISVATEERGSYFEADYKTRTWVDFTIDGGHHSRSVQARGRGTSYATAHAAAYGVLVADRDPTLDAEGIRKAIADFGDRPSGSFAGLPIRTTRIGSEGMIRDMTARLQEVSVRQPAAPTESPGRNPGALRIAAAMAGGVAR